MYVKIGPYKNWYGPYQLAKHVLFWMDKDDDRVDRFGNWLSQNSKGEDRYLTKLCYWIESKRKRKIKVRIDHYDTWSMDHTLAHIILPMLKQLKATKHGSPYVDDVDLPDHLKLSKRERNVFDNGHWNKKLKATNEEIDAASKKFHSGWEWVIDQMIWSFEQELDEDDGRKNYYEPYGPNEEIEDDVLEKVINDDGTVTETKPLFDKEWKRKMGKFNMEKYKAYQARKQLGFTLMGKYWQSLWD